jgi:GntR family transcriptional regulator
MIDLNDEFQRIFQRANFELHPESPVPIYYQLSRYLEKMIQDEVFQPGDRFPSEESIANYFLVSRPTANKAMQILLNEGWLTRDKQNKRSGTFVKEKPYFCISFLTEGMSFADQFSPDMPIKSQIIWTKTVPATGKVAKLLRLQEGEQIIHMRRLRFVCDQPILVCDSQLSETRFPGIVNGDFVQDSLYKTLEARYNCPIVSSERQAIAEEVIDPEIITLLGVHPFTSILMMTGVSYTYDDDPIDFLQTYLQPGVSLKNKIYRNVPRKVTPTP